MRVADADDPVLVEDDQAERPADPWQDLLERLDGVGGRLVCQERGQELRVGGRREAGAAAGQLPEQLARVDEIAVMADRERPPRALAVRGLGVLPDGGAGRRIAAVRDRQPPAQARQPALVEHRTDHPEVLVEHQLVAVADRDAGRFLAAVLEREQPERRDGGCLGGLAARHDRTEHAAHQEPSQPRARASPWSQACRRPVSGTSRVSAMVLPRSSDAPVAPAPTSWI